MTNMSKKSSDYLFDSQHAPNGLSPVVRRIESEYAEMPGLSVTEMQARRLWDLDANTCRIVLTTLVQRRFLQRTARGMFVRAA